MLVTSTALSEKQEHTETSAIIWLLTFFFFGRNFKDNLKSNRRLIDTVPKYIKEDFFLTLSFLKEERNSLKKFNTA